MNHCWAIIKHTCHEQVWLLCITIETPAYIPEYIPEYESLLDAHYLFRNEQVRITIDTPACIPEYLRPRASAL